MTDVAILLAGIVLAGAGGELFVRGSVGVAAALRVPPGIIAATVAAFATSSPELSVGITSALEGRASIALGDALGSNVVNLALVLGAGVVLGPLRVDRPALRRDLPVALASPVLVALLAADGALGRVDVGVLLLAFATWLARTTLEAARARSQAPKVLGAASGRWALAESVAGLVLLIAAGRLIVSAAAGIGASLGLDEFVVGATLVALGTSTPELATTIVSRLRRHDDVALGTILGSNIFNTLWIVGVAGAISPIRVDLGEILVAVAAGSIATLCVVPFGSATLGRRRGALLLGLYAAYVAALLATVRPAGP